MDCMTRYKRWLGASGYATNTVRTKLMVVTQVAAFAGVDPLALTRDDVESYLDRPLKTWTRIKYLEHLRGFAAWAGIADPTEGIRRPHQPRGVPRPVSEHGLGLIMGVSTKRTRCWIVLGAYAGLRSFEIAQLAAEDLEITTVGPALRVTGKGGRCDVVPVPLLVVQELAPWIAARPSGRLWPTVTPAPVQAAIARAGRAAGVPLTCHQLRHRYGTQLYAQSHDLLLVQQLMRHADPATTAGYARLLDDAGARLVDLLPLPRAA